MKNPSKILIVTAFFFLLAAFCVCAGEMKAAENVPAVVPESPATVEKTTLDNLQTAFNGESNASARYLAFAQKADEEGYGKAASLFRAAARAERVHFERHAKVIRELGGAPVVHSEVLVVKSTAENLEVAMKGEIYESTVMYPDFLVKAENDKIKSAIDAFEDAGAAEAIHADLYKEALENLKGWKGGNQNFYVCAFCGNVVEKIDFQQCPICGKSEKQFMAVK